MDGVEWRYGTGEFVCMGVGGKRGETTSGTMGGGWDWRQYRSTIPTIIPTPSHPTPAIYLQYRTIPTPNDTVVHTVLRR